MKKILSFFAALAISAIAFAQSPDGLKIGAGLSVNPYTYNPSGDWEPKATDGYHIFASYPFVISEVSSVAVGLRWEQTFNYKEIMKVRDTYTRGFISLPVKYEAHFGGFFINAGPTFSFWTLFKDTISNNGSKVVVNKFDKSQDGDQLNRFDVALGAEIGYDWRHFRLSVGYDYGLIKGAKTSAKPIVNFNRQDLRFSVAYIF